MDPKDKFDALLKLTEHKSQLREDRRRTEWKVSFGLWALMAATAYNLKDALAKQSVCTLIAALAIITLMQTFLWVLPMYLRNERDGRLAFYLAARAERIVMGDEGPPAERRPIVSLNAAEFFRFLRNPIAMSEPVITILLGTAAILITLFH
jgi:hypothetical protein